jgi:predicted transcriptional regulator
MRHSLFATLSREDFVDPNTETDLTTIEPEQVIDDTEATDELNEIHAEVKQDILTADDSEEVIYELQDKIVENEKLLETPEVVSSGSVVVAQESLKRSARILGVSVAAVSGLFPSNEAVNEDPVFALKISNESAREFIQGIVEKLKVLFERIKLAIKKLYTKLVVITSFAEKKAISLKSVVKNVKGTPTDLTAQDIKYISNILGVVIAVNHGNFSGDVSGIVGQYLSTVTNSNTINKMTANTAAVIKSITDLNAKPTIDIKDIYTVDDMILKTCDGKTYANAMLEKLTNSLMENKMFNIEGDKTNSALVSVIPIRFDGITIDGIGIISNTKIDVKDAKDLMTSTSIRIVKATLSPVIIDKFSIHAPTKEVLSKVLDNVINASKQTKSFSTNMLANIDKIDHDISKLYNLELTPELKDITRRTITTTRLVATHAVLNGVLGQVAATKAVLSYCNLCVKKFA